MLYSSGPVSVVDSVQSPLTMQTEDGRTFMVIHEADLVDYARMFLHGTRTESRLLTAALAPMADGVRRGRTPFMTPWRTIQVADKATGLAPSLLGLNLNPPNKLASTDWIHPMKYVGPGPGSVIVPMCIPHQIPTYFIGWIQSVLASLFGGLRLRPRSEGASPVALSATCMVRHGVTNGVRPRTLTPSAIGARAAVSSRLSVRVPWRNMRA